MEIWLTSYTGQTVCVHARRMEPTASEGGYVAYNPETQPPPRRGDRLFAHRS